MNRTLFALLLAHLSCSFALASDGNLVPNGSFEEVQPGKTMPLHWRGWAPFEGTEFGFDSTVAHGGTRSGTLETTGDKTGVLVTELIPVAPGEKLHASCWCRTEGTHTNSGGSLALTAEWVDRNGAYFGGEHTYIQVPKEQGKWFRMQLDAVAPQRAAHVAIEPGFRMITGKMWVDEVELTTPRRAAIRFNAATSIFSPGQTALPMVLINRSGKPGIAVSVKTEPGDQVTTLHSGPGVETSVTLPFSFTQRGKVHAIAQLSLPQTHEDFVTSVTGEIPALLVTEPLMPTHYILEDADPPHFESRFWVNEADQSRRELSFRCELLDQTGKIMAETQSSPVTSDTMTFQMSVPQRIAEPTTLTAHLMLERRGHIMAEARLLLRIIHRADATVTLGGDGYPRVDGKPFFPIGFYMGGENPEYRKAGFNVVQTYEDFTVDPGQKPNNTGILDFLDRAQARGFKALVFVNHGLSKRLGREESLRRIRMFRNHPAMLVWYEEEAVVRGIHPLSWLKQYVEDIRREGPGHPILIGDQSDEGANIKDRGNSLPVDLMDIGIWWWYPTPLHNAPQVEDYEGENAGENMEFVPPALLRNPKTNKPLWVALQCYRKHDADARYPTPEEYRCQAYIAVIHGAKGLFYYSGYDEDGGGILLHPKEGHWEQLKKLVGELSAMSPVFLSPNSKEQATCKEAMISTLLKDTGDGKRVLLAVNRCKQPIRAEFHLPGLSNTSQAKERFESRAVDMKAPNQFADDFGPYAVHVYDLH